MIYRNPTANTLRFEIAGDLYEVPPDGECDIAPRLAYVVRGRGLPLVEGSAGGKRVEAVEAPMVPHRLPPGVETGPSPEVADDDAEESEAVTDAVEKLKEQGAFPSKGKRGR